VTAEVGKAVLVKKKKTGKSLEEEREEDQGHRYEYSSL
jgi:hypothetical protein